MRTVVCPFCHEKLDATGLSDGYEISCPTCQQTFVVNGPHKKVSHSFVPMASSYITNPLRSAIVTAAVWWIISVMLFVSSIIFTLFGAFLQNENLVNVGTVLHWGFGITGTVATILFICMFMRFGSKMDNLEVTNAAILDELRKINHRQSSLS